MIPVISIWRIMQAGFRNLLRNAWLSTAATAVMTITLTIILISYVANLALTSTIKDIVEKIDVSVYLQDSTGIEQTQQMQDDLAAIDNVVSVKYISKNEALERYRQQNRNNPVLLEAVSEEDNPLPASLEIKVRDQNRLDPIEEYVNREEVKELLDPQNPTSYQGDRKATIDKIIQTSNFIRTLGLVSSVVFAFISTLIIFNTIRMAIFTRREEIEIMKLVGATNWFIRGPFLFEAALYGIIASVVSVVMVYTLLTATGPAVARNFNLDSVNRLFREAPALIMLVEVGIGIFIGIVSSMLAMMRHLKLK